MVVRVGLDRRARVVVGRPLAVGGAGRGVGVDCGQARGKDRVLGGGGQVLRGVGGGHGGVGHGVQGELQVSQSLLMFLPSHVDPGLTQLNKLNRVNESLIQVELGVAKGITV